MNKKINYKNFYGIMIMMRYFYITLFFIFILSFGYFDNVFSQSTQLNDTIEIEMVPEIPKADENVYVFLNSFITDINKANIIWKVNGKTIKSGIGEKNFNFKMGKDGQTTSLTISVKTTDGALIEKNFSLRSTSVDLIWESNGYTPPFYKGKPLFSHQNKVTLIAIPHIPDNNGNIINPRNMLYTWKKNGNVISEASGYAKNTYTFEGSLISRPVQITVEVSAMNGEGSGYANTTLTPVDPYVLIYKKDPTYGIEFQRTLNGNVNLSGSKEITVTGFPFYFNKDDKNFGIVGYKWLINGVFTKNEANENTKTFRKIEGASGSSNISLEIENINRILQSADNNFNINFNQN